MTLNTITVSTPDGQTGTASFTVTRMAAQKIGAVVSPLGGCPSSVNDWLSLGESTFGAGLNGVNKQFYSTGQKMTTWSQGHLPTDNESKLPPRVLSVICYHDEHIPSLPAYVASVPNDGRQVWMVLDQEAEDWYPGKDFATFIASQIKASQTIRAQGKPNVHVLQNCAGSQYASPTGDPAMGKWVVPPQYVDGYSIDCYQNQPAGQWPSQGLANYPPWLNWLKVYAGLGKPLAITEYGLNACSGATARQLRLQQDHDYLVKAFPPVAVTGQQGSWVSPFPLMWWTYWWSDCQAGKLVTDCSHQHQFTDAATVATFQRIMAGTA